MLLQKPLGKRILACLTYKLCGIAAFSFCAGTLAGLCLPIAFIAFLQALMLMLLAYLCIFQW